MKILILLLSLLTVTSCGENGNLLGSGKVGESIPGNFTPPVGESSSFSLGFDPLPNITSSNALSYSVSGSCDPDNGNITVIIGTPNITETFTCDSNGNFSGTIDVSTVSSNPPNISASQQTETILASPLPVNDQVGPASAPTATAPGAYIGGGSSYNLPISCSESGEIVSITGAGINPSPQNYTCSGTGTQNFPITLASPVETVNPNNLTISSTDQYGNPSATMTMVNVPIDTKGPVIAVTNGGGITQGQTASFTVTVTDANFTTINYSVNTSGVESSNYNCTTNPCNITTATITSAGSLTLTVVANSVNDDLGNSGDNVPRSSTLTVNAAASLGFNNPLATINSTNASSYPVSGTCDDTLGNVTVNVASPAASQSIACTSPGQFSGTINLSGVTSDPANVSVTQGVNTTNAAPQPTNDQTPIATAPTVANQSAASGSGTTLNVNCNEAGEVLSFSGSGLSPSPQTYTCADPLSNPESVSLTFASSTETGDPNAITLSSTDANGNPTINSTSFNLPIDTLAPTVAVAAGAGIVEGNNASFTVTVTDGSSFTAFTPTISSGSVSSGACSASPCTVTVTGASPGALTLTVAIGAVVDAVGNSNTTAASDSLNVTDDPSPTITAVSVSSTDGDADTWYENSDTITIAVQFSEIVNVNTAGGTPSIPVTLTSGAKTATYSSGTGSNTLNFNLSVVTNDEQCNGNLALGTFTLNGGIIQDSIGQDSINSGLASSVSGAQVDTFGPFITGSLNTSANNGYYTQSVTTTWAHTDNCSVASAEFALGRHNGTTCNDPVSIVNYQNVGLVTTYQAASGISPFTGANDFIMNSEDRYCSSVRVIDGAGNVSSPVASSQWSAFSPANWWTPANLASSLLWLDAMDSSSLTLSGTSVTSWSDKSGSSNHATGVLTEEPTYNAANFRVSFNTQYFTVPNLGAITEASLFIVLKADVLGSGGINFSNGSTSQDHLFWTDSNWYSSFATSGRPSVLSGLSAGTDLFIAQETTASNVNAYLNGGAPNTTSTSGSIGFGAEATNLIGGSRYIGTPFYYDGDMMEFIVLPNVLSTSERQKLEGYLAHKWNLRASLPLGHPYKITAPTP